MRTLHRTTTLLYIPRCIFYEAEVEEPLEAVDLKSAIDNPSLKAHLAKATNVRLMIELTPSHSITITGGRGNPKEWLPDSSIQFHCSDPPDTSKLLSQLTSPSPIFRQLTSLSVSLKDNDDGNIARSTATSKEWRNVFLQSPTLIFLEFNLDGARLRVDEENSFLLALVEEFQLASRCNTGGPPILPVLQHIILLNLRLGRFGLDDIARILQRRVDEGRRRLRSIKILSADFRSPEVRRRARELYDWKLFVKHKSFAGLPSSKNSDSAAL
jgi:hypothetical protein